MIQYEAPTCRQGEARALTPQMARGEQALHAPPVDDVRQGEPLRDRVYVDPFGKP